MEIRVRREELRSGLASPGRQRLLSAAVGLGLALAAIGFVVHYKRRPVNGSLPIARAHSIQERVPAHSQRVSSDRLVPGACAPVRTLYHAAQALSWTASRRSS